MKQRRQRELGVADSCIAKRFAASGEYGGLGLGLKTLEHAAAVNGKRSAATQQRRAQRQQQIAAARSQCSSGKHGVENAVHCGSLDTRKTQYRGRFRIGSPPAVRPIAPVDQCLPDVSPVCRIRAHLSMGKSTLTIVLRNVWPHTHDESQWVVTIDIKRDGCAVGHFTVQECF